MSDQYLTISDGAEGLYREKGSKFIAYSRPLVHEDDLKDALEELRKMHPKARHHCYAYRIGLDGNRFRANDDGEPSGSAGRPILGQIDSEGLTDVLVVVVRYFGGTKLGVPGLINAYKTSTAEALAHSPYIEKTVERHFKISFDYTNMGDVMNAIKRAGIPMSAQDFGEHPNVRIDIAKSLADETIRRFMALALKLPEEMVEGWEMNGIQVKEI